ncbi:MAG: TPR end-of-group domain-containing protein [Pontiellaceae bacterium]
MVGYFNAYIRIAYFYYFFHFNNGDIISESKGYMNRDQLSAKQNNEAIELALFEKLEKRLPNDTEILQVLAELYTKNKLYKSGLAVDLRLTKLEPYNGMVWYNLGCSFALNQQFDEAFEALYKAIEYGYNDYEWLKNDGDLDVLRDDKRYESLLMFILTQTHSSCEDEES